MEPHVDNFSNSHVLGFHLSSNKFNDILAVWDYVTNANRSEWINAVENTDGLPQHLICHGRSKVTLGWVCIILYSCPSPLSSALWGLDEALLQLEQSCHFPQQSYSRLKSQLFYWSGPSVMSFISEGSGVSVKDRQKHTLAWRCAQTHHILPYCIYELRCTLCLYDFITQ